MFCALSLCFVSRSAAESSMHNARRLLHAAASANKAVCHPLQALKQQLSSLGTQVTQLTAQGGEGSSAQGKGQARAGPEDLQAAALQQRLRKIELTVAGMPAEHAPAPCTQHFGARKRAEESMRRKTEQFASLCKALSAAHLLPCSSATPVTVLSYCARLGTSSMRPPRQGAATRLSMGLPEGQGHQSSSMLTQCCSHALCTLWHCQLYLALEITLAAHSAK